MVRKSTRGTAAPLYPGTLQPVGPDDLAPLFPMELIRQEVTGEGYVDTPARIYYKYEGGSPAGSHKPNTAVPQAYYNSVEGTKRLTTETGAGRSWPAG